MHRLPKTFFPEKSVEQREIVLLNAGAALYIGGKADSIEEGIRIAGETIDSGKAMETLESMVKTTNA